MDLTKPVTYRGVSLNNATPTVGRLGLTGCIVEQADIRQLTYTDFMEKRRLADGMDAIESYVALRKLSLQGTVFGQTRGQAWDQLQVLREAFNPVKALIQSPSTKGFLPFSYTSDLDYTLACRPMGLRYQWDSQKAGTNAKIAGKEDYVGLGIRWAAELLVDYSLDCGEWPPAPPPIFTCSTLSVPGTIQYAQLKRENTTNPAVWTPPVATAGAPNVTFVMFNGLEAGTAIGNFGGFPTPIPNYTYLDSWNNAGDPGGYDHTRFIWGYAVGATPPSFLPTWGGSGAASALYAAAYIPTRTTSFPNHALGPGSYCDLPAQPTPGSLLLFFLPAQTSDNGYPPYGPIPGGTGRPDWISVGGDLFFESGAVGPNTIEVWARCVVEADLAGPPYRIPGWHVNLVSWNLMVEVPIT